MNNASAQQKIFPLVPEHAASDMSAVLHMIPAEKAGALPSLGVKLPDDVAASFRGTPFTDLYEEALNLLRSRNITADELRYLSRALTQLLAKRTTGEAEAVSPFYIRQARLSDVDALEGLVKYGPNRAKTFRANGQTSSATSTRLPFANVTAVLSAVPVFSSMTPGSLKSVRSALPPTFSARDKVARLLNICSNEPAGSISTKFSC